MPDEKGGAKMQRVCNSIELIKKKLLVFVDQMEIASIVQTYQGEGFFVEQKHFRQFDSDLLTNFPPDLVVFDLDTPSMEAISTCQALRNCFSQPIIVLSANTSELLQILALEMGADDFLVKPLPANLLLAKIRALLRREDKSKLRQKTIIQLGELVIDAGRREVWSSGETIPLTAREFDLLWCLAENSRTIISRDEIHQSLYKCEYNGFDRSIDIYISRIRQKLGDDPHNPRYLKTIRGAGYLLVGNSRV